MLGCAGQVDESAAKNRDALVLFHATNGVFRIQKSKLAPADFKQRVENFFPAVCVDSDVDDDSLPDEFDDDSDDREPGDDHGDASSSDDHSTCRHSGGGDDRSGSGGGDDGDHSGRGGGDDDDGDDHRDGGEAGDDRGDHDDDGEDDDEDERENRLHRCRVCNRGPGTQGDFRFEVRGSEGRLERGRVATRVGNTIQVAAPGGVVTITLSAASQVRGDPTPGSEIRVRGTVQGATQRTVAADELEVLCPGPTPVTPEQVPPGADPVVLN